MGRSRLSRPANGSEPARQRGAQGALCGSARTQAAWARGTGRLAHTQAGTAVTNWSDHDGPGDPPPPRRYLLALAFLFALLAVCIVAGALLITLPGAR